MRIDNGTHILLSGNTAALAFCRASAATALMQRAPSAAGFPSSTSRPGERWTLDLGDGRLPLWIFDRRPPGAGHAARSITSRWLRLLWPGADQPLGSDHCLQRAGL